MKHRKLALAATLVAALGTTAAPAAAKNLQVDDNGAQCPNATFTSVQAAVSAAAPGDKVQVCAGTYTEQVTIANRDGLALQGKKGAVIRYPAGVNGPLIHVDSSDQVDIRDLTLTGPYAISGCVGGSDRHRGIYLDNSFGANIQNNVIDQIRDANTALRGCQDGVGVQVGNNSEGTSGSGVIRDNIITAYQKGGVVVDGGSSSGTVTHNAIDAQVVQVPGVAAPNGIQVSREATGQVDHNDVTGNSGQSQGSGILLFQLAGGVQVDHNTTHDNDDNLPLVDADNLVIDHNTSLRALAFDGLFADSDSTGNLFKDNVADDNAEHDCHDDSTGTGTAGTANTWRNDRGDTQTPTGICVPNKK